MSFDVRPLADGCFALHDTAHDSHAVVAPWRGALVRSLRVAGRELLYLDASSFDDATRNVRGGIPVLFPSPGKLRDDAWQHGGRGGTLPQHGFARREPWQVLATGTDGAARLVLGLDASDATAAVFPWRFALELHFTLTGQGLRIEARLHNRDVSPMPWALGFHPYFVVTDRARARVPTAATRAWDNVAKATRPFAGFDLTGLDFTGGEVDLHLHDHGAAHCDLELPGAGTVRVSASPEFDRWVVWSPEAAPFVCVEPWTAPGDALNSGDGLRHLPPGEQAALWMAIDYAADGTFG